MYVTSASVGETEERYFRCLARAKNGMRAEKRKSSKFLLLISTQTFAMQDKVG